MSGEIEDYLVLGANTALTLRIGASAGNLYLSVPTHVARRNDLARGSMVKVSLLLLAEAIHLMARMD